MECNLRNNKGQFVKGFYQGSGFKKGIIPWNKGTKGICKSNKTSFKQGVASWNKDMTGLPGRHTMEHSEETKQKISEAIKKQWQEGKTNGFKKGKLHWNWKNGATNERQRIESSKEYKNWRKSIFERDDYTCVFCGIHGGNLNADHIKPFSLFPKLRLELDNGRTLCLDCHRTTETYGNRKKVYGFAGGIGLLSGIFSSILF